MTRSLRSSCGSAVPLALGVLTLTLLLAVAAVQQGLAASGTSQHDRRAKRAQQAAEAGIEATIWRMNKLDVTSTVLPCAVKLSGGALSLAAYELVVGSEWCPAVVDTLAGGASVSTRVSKAIQVTGAQVTLDRVLVATGTVGGVSRRARVKLSALRGTPLFPSGYAVLSLDDLNIVNSVQISGGARSNGNISLSNSAQICAGNATPGPGKSVTLSNSASVCPPFLTTPAETPFVLAPVDQGTAATVNDNARICVLDACTSQSKISWNAATRRLALNNNSSLTLGGSVYSFCQLDLNNSATLIIPVKQAGSSVRIYIDAPENCTGSPRGGFNKSNSAGFNNLNSDPVTVQMYVAGSPTIPTDVQFVNNSLIAGINLALYAPQSTVTISNYARINGAVAAKKVVMSNNSQVIGQPSVGSIQTDSIHPIYRQVEFRGCSTYPPVGSAPDAGC